MNNNTTQDHNRRLAGGPIPKSLAHPTTRIAKLGCIAGLTWTMLAPAQIGADEEPVAFSPGIREVTVYPDRALVVRSAKVTLPAGKHRLVFRDGAPGLDRDSLRAFSENRDIIVQGVASYLERSATTFNDQVRARQEEVEALEKEAGRLGLAQDRLRRDLSGIERYYGHILATISEQSALPSGRAEGARAWEKARSFLLVRRIATQQRLHAAEEKMRDVQEKISIARRRLQKISTGGEKSRRIIEVSVRVVREATADVGFSYIIGGAGWSVSYGLALITKDAVDVDYYGNVRQKTGEDWKGVRLNLSVSQPALGAQRPTLRPLVVAGIKAETKQVIVMKDEKEKDDDTRSGKPESGGEGGTTDGDFTGLKAEGASLVFQIKRTVSIPSADRSRRVTIARFQTKPGDLHYRVVGMQRRAAYLAARLSNKQAFPMMAGPADIFRTSGFIGRSSVAYTPAGSSFLIGFGLERSVRIIREVRRREESGGLLSSDRVFETSILVTVSNPGTEARRVSVFERIPVPEIEEIGVAVDESATTPGRKEARKGSGLLRWTYDLKAGEKQKVALMYRVRVPRKLNITVYGK